MSVYFLPIFVITTFFYGLIKKVKPYNAFTEGVSSSIPTVVKIFPCLVAIFVMTELFEISGLSNYLVKFLSPFFNLLGIPKELTKLVLIKPFSGSGSLAFVSEIYSCYGVDSYIARCASVIYGSSETVFYVATVYFAGAKTTKLFKPVIISLFASFLSCVFACFICKIL